MTMNSRVYKNFLNIGIFYTLMYCCKIISNYQPDKFREEYRLALAQTTSIHPFLYLLFLWKNTPNLVTVSYYEVSCVRYTSRAWNKCASLSLCSARADFSFNKLTTSALNSFKFSLCFLCFIYRTVEVQCYQCKHVRPNCYKNNKKRMFLCVCTCL